MLDANEIAAKPAPVSWRKSCASSRGRRRSEEEVRASRALAGWSCQRKQQCEKRASDRLAAASNFASRSLPRRRLVGRRFASAINTRAIARFFSRRFIRANFLPPTSHDSRVTNHALRGGTVNRPCTHVSHRKQTIAHMQGRNFPVHFLFLIFGQNSVVLPLRSFEGRSLGSVIKNRRGAPPFRAPCASRLAGTLLHRRDAFVFHHSSITSYQSRAFTRGPRNALRFGMVARGPRNAPCFGEATRNSLSSRIVRNSQKKNDRAPVYPERPGAPFFSFLVRFFASACPHVRADSPAFHVSFRRISFPHGRSCAVCYSGRAIPNFRRKRGFENRWQALARGSMAPVRR